MKLTDKTKRRLHRTQHAFHHLHHIVEAAVAFAVSVGHHYIEISASGILGVVVICVVCLDVLEA